MKKRTRKKAGSVRAWGVKLHGGHFAVNSYWTKDVAKSLCKEDSRKVVRVEIREVSK